jgi:hypothetical protein
MQTVPCPRLIVVNRIWTCVPVYANISLQDNVLWTVYLECMDCYIEFQFPGNEESKSLYQIVVKDLFFITLLTAFRTIAALLSFPNPTKNTITPYRNFTPLLDYNDLKYLYSRILKIVR